MHFFYEQTAIYFFKIIPTKRKQYLVQKRTDKNDAEEDKGVGRLRQVVECFEAPSASRYATGQYYGPKEKNQKQLMIVTRVRSVNPLT
jgi:hypothetical protein